MDDFEDFLPIILVIIAFIILVIILVVFYMRRKRQANSQRLDSWTVSLRNTPNRPQVVLNPIQNQNIKKEPDMPIPIQGDHPPSYEDAIKN